MQTYSHTRTKCSFQVELHLSWIFPVSTSQSESIQTTFMNTAHTICFEHISTIFGQVANKVAGCKRGLLLLVIYIDKQTSKQTNKHLNKYNWICRPFDGTTINWLLVILKKNDPCKSLRCILLGCLNKYFPKLIINNNNVRKRAQRKLIERTRWIFLFRHRHKINIFDFWFNFFCIHRMRCVLQFLL